MERMFLLDMAFEIRNLPEPITMTAGMAMFTENEQQVECCAAMLDYVLTQPGSSEMKEAIDALAKQFMEVPPPGYENLDEKEALKLAKAIMALGAIVELHDMLGDYVEHTIIAIVEGTKTAIKNFGDFVSDNV